MTADTRNRSEPLDPDGAPRDAPPASEYPSLTIAQVVERLPISDATFYRIRKHGGGPQSFLIGGREFFRESDVFDWLEEYCRRGRR